MKLSVSEQKKLRDCRYNNGYDTWLGHTDGIIENGCIKIYPAVGKCSKKWYFKKIDFVYVPLTSVYYF